MIRMPRLPTPSDVLAPKPDQIDADRLNKALDPDDRLDKSLKPGMIPDGLPQVSILKIQESLANALAGLESRYGELHGQHHYLESERRRRVHKTVEVLVPDLSRTTAEQVFQHLPSMDTSAIRKSFSAKKMLGLFETQAYTRAMDHVKMTLAMHLHQNLNGSDDFMGQELLNIQKSLTEINASRSDLVALLKKAQQAQAQGIQMVPDITAGLQDARQADPRTSKREAGRSSGRSSAAFQAAGARGQMSNESAGTYPSSQSDLDLWLYFLADTPTSMRTVLWSALSHSADPDFHRAPPWGPVEPHAMPSPESVPGFDFGSARALGEPVPEIPAVPTQSGQDGSAWPAQTVWQGNEMASPLLPSFSPTESQYAEPQGSFS